MDNSKVRLLLRKRAVESVRESTEMLKQAFALRRSGHQEQAEQLQTAARAKRNDSVWLMQKANKLDHDAS